MKVRNLITLGFGLLGMLIAHGVWHLWTDHNTFHELLDAIQRQNLQQIQQSKEQK